MTNQHCIVCDKVYYGKERVWLPDPVFRELELGRAQGGVLHDDCLTEYLHTYIHNVPEEDRKRLRLSITDRIREVNSYSKRGQ